MSTLQSNIHCPATVMSTCYYEIHLSSPADWFLSIMMIIVERITYSWYMSLGGKKKEVGVRDPWASACF